MALFGSPLQHDIDPSALVTPDFPQKNVSFGQAQYNEYDPLSNLYSPSQPFYDLSQPVPPFIPFDFSDPARTTPALVSNQASNPPPLQKSILKRKRASAKSVPSRSTSSGSCKDSSQNSIKIESDDEDHNSSALSTKKHRNDSVPVNVLVDLIKSLNSINQGQVASQSTTTSAISSVIGQAAVKCSGPIRDLRSAMELVRGNTSTSTKTVGALFVQINIIITFRY